MGDKLSIPGGVKILSKYILRYKLNFILFYIGWFIDSIFTVITPVIFAIMIDEIVYYRNVDVFLKVSLVFVVMSIFSCILYFLIYTQHHYLMSMYTFDIKLDLFKKMQSMKASYMSDVKTGDIISMLLSDTQECVHFVIRNVIHLINGLLRGIFYIVYIYIISIQAGLIVTLFLPLAVYSAFKFGKRIREQTDKQREIYGVYISWLFEILKGLTDIRLLCAQRVITRDFTDHLRSLFKNNIKTSISNLASEKIIELINLLMQLSIYGICAYFAINGNLTIGNVLVLVSFVFTLKDDTIMSIAHSFMDAQSRLTRITRLKKFLDEDDESSWQGKRELEVTGGNIEFKSISFSYGLERPILHNFCAVVPAGSNIALVGKSGCGKTTLASLLIGMYTVDSGEILIDGQNIADCSLMSIRKNVGFVQQDTLIINGTIRENLLFGNPKAKDDEIWKACRAAGIAGFIDSLPQRLDTSIGSEGTGLSGGQRQRLAIARIYLKNPPIIIFDEATSALDTETEKIIHEAWKDLLKGRTAIVIAHRMSSVMLCDKAVIVEDTRVKAVGRPIELMQSNGKFRELFAVKEA